MGYSKELVNLITETQARAQIYCSDTTRGAVQILASQVGLEKVVT
jgi:hypothetical protein